MIVGQRQSHGGIGLNFAVYLADAGGDGVNTENTGLGSVDNGSEALDTVGADVGNGEGCTGQHVGGCSAVLAGCGKLFCLGRDFVKVHILSIFNGGNHKSSVGVHGNAQVNAVKISHGVR